MRPLWEKSLNLIVKLLCTDKIFEIDRENHGFLRKRPPPLSKSWRPAIIALQGYLEWIFPCAIQ
jgi:hypothetical protein